MKYTEIFYSPQGEGQYTGVSSLWIRFFMCNLECSGFNQKTPTDPQTFKPVGKMFDLTHIKKIEDLPVFEYGCDSAYSVSAKYKHLITEKTAQQAVDELESKLPTGKFKHTKSGQETHLCITGGEPFMKQNQNAIIELFDEMIDRGNFPKFVTFETNGTQILSKELVAKIKYMKEELGIEFMFSVSPKLWNVSGEKRTKAIKPEVVQDYYYLGNKGQLKFVLNGTQESWDELEEVVKLFRDAGVMWDIWVMGIGGTLEGLKISEAKISDMAIERGYNYTSRMHVHVYGNIIGK